MGRAKTYKIGEQYFPRQKDLDQKIKKHLNMYPMNKPFHDQFLADVINTLHEDVCAEGQHSTGWFQYLDYKEQINRGYLETAKRYRGGKLLLGHFEPLHDWRDVTVYPHKKNSKTNIQHIREALREKINIPKPDNSLFCAINGCNKKGEKLEYHHLRPTYNEMFEVVKNHLTQQEISSCFGYKKFTHKPTYSVADFIPDDHPAVKKLEELHENNEWQWLCKKHHRNVGE